MADRWWAPPPGPPPPAETPPSAAEARPTSDGSGASRHGVLRPPEARPPAAAPPAAEPPGVRTSAARTPPPAPQRRLPLALGGILIALAGVIGAGALWWIADGRHDDTIADFARAPAGCDTTLTFERQGRYVVYVETVGAIERIDGDCDAVGPYSHPGETDPAFELVIVDVDGTPIALGAHSGIAYDADGYVGSSVASVQIDGPGRYVMRVASPVDDFVVAVGTDPDAAAGMLRLGAISVLIGGLVVGGTALVFAAVRRDTAGPDAETVTAVWTGSTWADAAGVPSGPKGIPGEALQPPQRLPWAPPRVDGQ